MPEIHSRTEGVPGSAERRETELSHTGVDDVFVRSMKPPYEPLNADDADLRLRKASTARRNKPNSNKGRLKGLPNVNEEIFCACEFPLCRSSIANKPRGAAR